MRKLVFISLFFVIWLWSIPSKSQDNFVSYQINLFEHPKEKEYLSDQDIAPFFLLQSIAPLDKGQEKNWEKLLKKLDQRQNKIEGDDRFLADIFFTTHQIILKRYEQISNFSKTIHSGVYDCVSGTGIFALLLDRYEIPYEIIETAEHVYLKGEFKGQAFVFESTFPQEGLIYGEQKVADFEEKFIFKDNPARTVRMPKILGKVPVESSVALHYNAINLRELSGIQYYNDAIKKFNDKDYEEAYIQLVKASFLYPSSRIMDFKSKMEMLLGIVLIE